MQNPNRFGLLLVCAGLMAQEPAIHVTTRLVQVSVLVHDKRGEPVAGLRKDDFTVFDQGKQQTLAFFTADDGPQIATDPADLPPGIYSNRHSRTATSHATVVLLDGLNTNRSDLSHARTELARFMSQIQPGDPVAIYTLTSHYVRVLHDFTDNAELLNRFLAKLGSGGADALYELMSSDQASIDYNPPGVLDRVRWTLEAIEGISQHMAAIPGRKNLIWVSSAFPLALIPGDAANNRARISLADQIRHTANSLTDANIAIYPVDAHGLMTNPAFTSQRSGASSNAQLSSLSMFTTPNVETMKMIAERSGGRAFYNTNDAYGAIRAALNDAKISYTLGFYSAESDWDGKFHELRVKVDRPGADVRFRKGFVASFERAPKPQDLSSIVANALASPLDGAAIGIKAQVGGENALNPRRIAVQVSAEEIYLAQKGDRWEGSLAVVYAQFGPTGNALPTVQQDLELNLTQARYQEGLKRGLTFSRDVEIAPQAETLKIVMVDKTTGREGSLKIPLKSN